MKNAPPIFVGREGFCVVPSPKVCAKEKRAAGEEAKRKMEALGEKRTGWLGVGARNSNS